MRGDPKLGAVVRGLRVACDLTLTTVAHRTGCSTSLLSQIETGSRTLKPRVAAALDVVFGSGGTLTTLATGAYPEDSEHHAFNWSDPADELILVHIPGQGMSVPVSRRELLAALGIGAISGTLVRDLRQAAAALSVDEELLTELDSTLTGLQAAARILPPRQLLGPLTGHVALADVVRHHAPDALKPAFMLLQTRAAEALSWMAEESGDLIAALYWIDRTGQWASAVNWPAMIAYAHVRRSMLAISSASDGKAAVAQAARGLRVPAAPARVRAMATKQIAFGYALSGNPDGAKRALDKQSASSTSPRPGQKTRRWSASRASAIPICLPSMRRPAMSTLAAAPA